MDTFVIENSRKYSRHHLAVGIQRAWTYTRCQHERFQAAQMIK